MQCVCVCLLCWGVLLSCVLICIPFPPQPPMAETGGRAGAVEAVAAQAVGEEGPMTMGALMQAAEAVEAEAAVVPYYERLVARLSEDWVEGDDRMGCSMWTSATRARRRWCGWGRSTF